MKNKTRKIISFEEYLLEILKRNGGSIKEYIFSLAKEIAKNEYIDNDKLSHKSSPESIQKIYDICLRKAIEKVIPIVYLDYYRDVFCRGKFEYNFSQKCHVNDFKKVIDDKVIKPLLNSKNIAIKENHSDIKDDLDMNFCYILNVDLIDKRIFNVCNNVSAKQVYLKIILQLFKTEQS